MRDWSFLKFQCENQFYVGVEADLLKEAIAEIEQLRAQSNTLREHNKHWGSVNEQLQQEKAELVEALKKCLTIVRFEGVRSDTTETTYNIYQSLIDQANKALGGGEPK